jgi:hypothetical protein
LGRRAHVLCEVARTAAEQARGLQGHPGLAEGTGMLFPFRPARAASFHMGTVRFPIDLVFADASGTVRRIVHAAEPGSRTVWREPVVGCVVETPGGYAARIGLELGDQVRVGVPPPFRGRSGGRRVGVAPEPFLPPRAVELDAGEFVPAMLEAAARAGVPWEPLVLNDSRERAVVSAAAVGQWLHTLGLPEAERLVVHDAASSAEGLEAIGTGFIAAGMAETADLGTWAHEPVLVLTRRRQV